MNRSAKLAAFVLAAALAPLPASAGLSCQALADADLAPIVGESRTSMAAETFDGGPSRCSWRGAKGDASLERMSWPAAVLNRATAERLFDVTVRTVRAGAPRDGLKEISGLGDRALELNMGDPRRSQVFVLKGSEVFLVRTVDLDAGAAEAIARLAVLKM